MVAQVDDPNGRAEGQRAMRACHFFGIITLSACSLFAQPSDLSISPYDFDALLANRCIRRA
jgi:hypothetical protein